MDKYTRITFLYDFYGNLLSPRQREVLPLYYEDNLSLSEIGEELGITRQGVYDTLHNGEKALVEYENRLKLAERFKFQEDKIQKADEKLDDLLKKAEDKKTLLSIKTILDDLRE